LQRDSNNATLPILSVYPGIAGSADAGISDFLVGVDQQRHH
jgi:hypothetical protein